MTFDLGVQSRQSVGKAVIALLLVLLRLRGLVAVRGVLQPLLREIGRALPDLVEASVHIGEGREKLLLHVLQRVGQLVELAGGKLAEIAAEAEDQRDE